MKFKLLSIWLLIMVSFVACARKENINKKKEEKMNDVKGLVAVFDTNKGKIRLNLK